MGSTSRFVAHDGTVCGTEEEMKTINERVEKSLLPDKLHATFGIFRSHEELEWLQFNVFKRGLPQKVDKWGFRQLAEVNNQ